MSLRIVVADDHRGMLDWLTARLGQDFEVVAAVQEGDAALDAVKRLDPDVVVLDLAMKPINGLEVMRLIRVSGNNVPVVLITGYTDPMLREGAISAGAQGFVVKSRLVEELVPTVRDAAQKRIISRKSSA